MRRVMPEDGQSFLDRHGLTGPPLTYTTAEVYGGASDTNVMEGEPMPNGLGTAVFEKRGKDWKIMHWHTSAPRSKPTEKKPRARRATT